MRSRYHPILKGSGTGSIITLQNNPSAGHSLPTQVHNVLTTMAGIKNRTSHRNRTQRH